MQHSFDVDIAKEYGVPEAIILCHFQFWIAKNQANGVNFHDGEYWTYNSMKAFTELFPYLSRKRIEKALNHLRDEGIIQTGNYNQSTYDRTLWYAFTQKGKCILLKREMDDAEKGNGFTDSGKCIYTDIDHIENTDKKPYTTESEFEMVWALYPRKEGKKTAFAAYQRARKNGTSFETIRDGIKAYAEKVKRERTEPRYIKMGQTFFNGECWNDESNTEQPKQETGRAAVSYDLTAAENQAAQGAPVYQRRKTG